MLAGSGILKALFWLGILHVPLTALSQLIGVHSTNVSIRVRLLSRDTLLKAKNSTGIPNV